MANINFFSYTEEFLTDIPIMYVESITVRVCYDKAISGDPNSLAAGLTLSDPDFFSKEL